MLFIGSPGWARTSDFLINSPARDYPWETYQDLSRCDGGESLRAPISVRLDEFPWSGTRAEPAQRSSAVAAPMAVLLLGQEIGPRLSRVQRLRGCFASLSRLKRLDFNEGVVGAVLVLDQKHSVFSSDLGCFE